MTGAAQGIGLRIAEILAEEGYRLYLTDLNTEKLSAVAERIGARHGHVDISDRASCLLMTENATTSLGQIDALVNVAAIDAQYMPGSSITVEHWSGIIDTNLSGTWWCINAILDHMVELGGGRVINISSAWAFRPSKGVSVAYAASKAAVAGLTVALAEEYESAGILVNAIAAGATGNTGTPIDPHRAANYQRSHPLGFGGPDPVAHMVSHLLGPGGDWVSGAVMNVSGGYLRG
ncbi:SDR family oxidoreductase [Microbacterium sp. zg.B48]|uniref:SDR family NAD(P)-dependent oxidoreductase n=1 Tax=Microbacterium sp. zg.B48 TaxID=2969408 RepID=UPI00214CC221|nr:SDR family oxidoreductase [Microbacterium sp. zg.B48]MCR2762477.1 SDR family oxidoreductase [Microbacterium sp. zg.B48]